MRDVTLTELEQAHSRATEMDVPLQMDHDAFAAFYGRTARPLWRYLARITGDRQLADDLLQDTYYRFLRAGSTYESEAHRRNALYLIATNLARDGRRRAVGRPTPVVDPEEVLRQQPAPGTPNGAERAADVRDALDRIGARDRSLLWLAYGEGANHREIAGVLGVQASSVKAMLFRARRRLAALLGGAPVQTGGDHA
jgi:RNA polymerase sigma-70 factor (ECF subfamily)